MCRSPFTYAVAASYVPSLTPLYNLGNDDFVFEKNEDPLKVSRSGPKADPNWGGCNVWLSTDGASDTQIGTISGPAAAGVRTAVLPAFAGSNPDSGDTVAVNMASQ